MAAKAIMTKQTHGLLDIFREDAGTKCPVKAGFIVVFY